MQNSDTEIRCLYCGKGRLKLHHGSGGSDDTYVCGSCGLYFTETDCSQDFFASNSSGENEGEAGAEENAVLEAAWEQMQKQSWDRAADILSPPHSPLRHAPEFIVYRNICQSALLLKNLEKDKRVRQIDILRHNLGCLEYFLSDPNGEEVFQILQNLYRALMLWGNLEITCLTDYTRNMWGSPDIDTTNRRRAEILCSFADVLKERGSDDVHGTDYLKMAVQLRSQALVLAMEKYNSHFNVCDEEFLQLPMEMRRKIKAEIELLNELIKQRDPYFVPPTVPPDPKLYPVPPILFSGPGFCILVILPFMIFDFKKISPFTAALCALYFMFCLSAPYLYIRYYDNCRRSKDFCRHCQ